MALEKSYFHLPHVWPSRWYMYTTSSIRNIRDLEDICALPTRHVIMCIKSVMAWPNISFLLEINLFLIHDILFHIFLHQVFTRVIKLQQLILIFLKMNTFNYFNKKWTFLNGKSKRFPTWEKWQSSVLIDQKSTHRPTVVYWRLSGFRSSIECLVCDAL